MRTFDCVLSYYRKGPRGIETTFGAERMKAKHGHLLGMLLCGQIVAYSLLAIVDVIYTKRVPITYWGMLFVNSSLEIYNLYRLRGKFAEDEW